MSGSILIVTTAGSDIASFSAAITANIAKVAGSATVVTITGANGDKVIIKGTGFTFDALGNVTAGTVTDVNWLDNGAVYAQASGFSVDAVQSYNFVKAGDILGLASLFGDLTFRGNAGGDTGSGGTGNDLLLGGAGDDFLYGFDGNDTVEGGDGADTLVGGAGIDTLFYGKSAAGVSVNLDGALGSGGQASGDHYLGFENITGSDFADRLKGNSLANELLGGFAADKLTGLGGADTLNGGSGVDTASYTTSNAAVHVNLLAGTASGGHAAGDVLLSIENLEGSSFSDSLVGNAAKNKLTGAGGNDSLDGGLANDTLLGGLGNDRLIGGQGVDTITGNDGADTFVLTPAAANRDIILDFVSGTDHLEIKASLFGGGLVAGIGLAIGQLVINTTGLAGDADDRFILNSTTGELFYDVNGNVSGATGSRLIVDFNGIIPALTIADFLIV